MAMSQGILFGKSVLQMELFVGLKAARTTGNSDPRGLPALCLWLLQGSFRASAAESVHSGENHGILGTFPCRTLFE